MVSLCKNLAALVGAGLLAGELVVAMLGMWFPREPQMYRDFYINRSRDCWLPADVEASVIKTLARPEIDPPRMDPRTACFVLAHGWNPVPPWGETTQAVTSWLVLPPLPDAKALDMTLADTSPASAQTIRVRLGSGPAKRVILPPGRVPVELRLDLPANPKNLIKLRFDRPHEPDGNPMIVSRLKWTLN
jgi:hypothetical protein